MGEFCREEKLDGGMISSYLHSPTKGTVRRPSGQESPPGCPGVTYLTWPSYRHENGELARGPTSPTELNIRKKRHVATKLPD